MKRLCCLLVLAAAGVLASPSAEATLIFATTLRGSNEVPTNSSTAIGTALVTLENDNKTLDVHEVFSGLTGGPASAAHIHCCVGPGVATIVAVPFPVPPFPAATSGTFDGSFDLSLASTYNAAFITAHGGTVATAEADFIAGLKADQTYANIHNATFPGGEIRGQLDPVPEPASLVLLGSALLGFGLIRRRSLVAPP